MRLQQLLFPFLLSFLFLSCESEPGDLPENKEISTEEKMPLSETQQMANDLKDLVTFGDPNNYLYWNTQRAKLFKDQLSTVNETEYRATFYNYSNELLLAGDTRTCIKELENYIGVQESNYAELITDDNYAFYELLGLAYLRLGEQENCQNAHTPFSCILPLQDPALHELKEGSQKAIEVFDVIQSYYPQEKYKWLINVAYMTLGEHPNSVPKKHRLNFPNWKLEQRNFPRFEEISMNVGLAENGLSGGTCIDDFNGDGLLDIFATSSGMNDQAKLFLNAGDGTFKDETAKAGLTGLLGGLNCIHADYNNDGFRDILVLRGGWLAESGKHPNSLLKNNGDGTFSDVTQSAGLLSHHPTQTADWADFNKDGFLDLFIGNESEVAAHPCELYQNNGDGTFSEVSEQYGLGGINGFIKGVSWGDINNDGWPDLYISNVRGNNLLYKNNEGQFEEIGKEAGVQDPRYSFPCWFWDANNDGYQDIFVSGYDLTDLFDLASDYALELQEMEVTRDKPRLYINNGDETFSEATEAYDIFKTMYAMGANFGDLDNDGYQDFYVGTGAPEYTTIVPNRMFRSVNGKRFEEVTSAGGFGHIQKGHGVAFADLDQDGDQDIYSVMGGVYEGDYFTNILFENPGFGNNWIVIELKGVTTNLDAIGSRIEITLDNGRKINRTVGTGGSFGASSIQQEIGLAKAGTIKTLAIHWQNGSTQTMENIEVNQKIRITEGSEEIETITYERVPFSTENQGVHHH